MKLIAVGITDVGRKREHNEDHFAIAELPLVQPLSGLVDSSSGSTALAGGLNASGILCVVADGMGGAKSGEVASAMATMNIANRVSEQFNGFLDMNSGAVESSLLDTIREVNQALIAASEESDELEGMSTTLTAFLAFGPIAYWVQSGDSRLYRLRGDVFEILTPDQSAVGTLFQNGDLSEEQARRHPYKNIIDQCMGGSIEDPFEPVAGSIDLQPEDAFVLCSDGLMDGLWDAEIEERLRSLRNGKDPARVVEALVYDAKKASGMDNITAIVGYVSRDKHQVSESPFEKLAGIKSKLGNWLSS